jgi:hypothetical protein
MASWAEAAAVALGYLLLSLASAACVALGLYQVAEALESHPHHARSVLLRVSAATAAAHLIYAALDPRALAANAVGLLDQAALQLVLRARAWPAVPLDAPPLLAAAALVVLDQAAWAVHTMRLVPGHGLAAAAARLPRLVGLLGVFVWPVPAGVLLTLAVAADPLPVSVGSPRRATAAVAAPLDGALGARGGGGSGSGPPSPDARLQPRRPQAAAAAAAARGALGSGPSWRDGGGGSGGGKAGAAARPQPPTQGRLLRAVRGVAARLGVQLDPGQLPVRLPEDKR